LVTLTHSLYDVHGAVEALRGVTVGERAGGPIVRHAK
jgi:hypothetical protein